MSRFLLAFLIVATAGIALATPRTFNTRIVRTAPASGPSTAASVAPGYYTFTATVERTCLCIGRTTCADDEASKPICVNAGDRIEVTVPGTAKVDVSFWSATGAGKGDVLGWTP